MDANEWTNVLKDFPSCLIKNDNEMVANERTGREKRGSHEAVNFYRLPSQLIDFILERCVRIAENRRQPPVASRQFAFFRSLC